MTEELAAIPLIDDARFAELESDFGPEGAQEIIGSFLEETDRQVAAIEAAVAAGGTGATIAGDAHTVKGGAMLVGAARLQQAALDVERTGRADADATPAAAALRTAWDATRARLT